MQAEINLGGELKITPATETEKYAVLTFVINSKGKLTPRLEPDELFVTTRPEESKPMQPDVRKVIET